MKGQSQATNEGRSAKETVLWAFSDTAINLARTLREMRLSLLLG